MPFWKRSNEGDLNMEANAGIVAEHSKGIRRIAKEFNSFILIRPTNRDSTRLIKLGYATKSMDVHDKSSDWGPMAGFVPQDPAFNKKRPGKPGTQPKHDPHGAAQVVQLSLKDSLRQSLEREGKIVKLQGNGTRYKAGQKFNGYADEIVFELTRSGGDWNVSYTFERSGATPLMVWAYNSIPVTGDYDLWMVAPHITYLTTGGFDLSRMMGWKHSEKALADRGLGEHSADSAATTFLIHMIPKLNEACGRANNPVFMHGAENQNYGFLQELDPKLAIFSPGGRAAMIESKQFARVMAEMSSRGYLPIWNTRYDGDVNEDPMFNGVAGSGPSNPKAKEVHNLITDLFGDLESLADEGDDLSVLVKEDFPKGGRDKLPGDVIAAQTRIQKVLAKSVQLTGQAVGTPDIEYIAKCLLAAETESTTRPGEGAGIRAAQQAVKQGDALSLTTDLMFLYNYWQRNGDRARSAQMKKLADQMARERTVGFNLKGQETRVRRSPT
jgi:hypothetical protein